MTSNAPRRPSTRDAAVPSEVATWIDKRGLTLSGRPLPSRRDALESRERVVQAAARIFASVGYANAHVRDIAGAAGAPPSAINKFFGSKEALYREVLVTHQLALYRDEAPPDPTEFGQPEEALKALIRFKLRLVLIRASRTSIAGQLIVRELQDPTPALDDLIDIYVVPIRRAFSAVIGDLLGDRDNRTLRRQIVDLVFGLCVYPELAAELKERLDSPPPRTEEGVEQLAETLYTFVLSGIRAVASSDHGVKR